MNTEHTAENWTAFQNPEDEGSNYWRIRMQDGLKDSLHGYCGKERACLIAAAPDLLEALNDMLSILDDAGTEDEETWQPGQRWIFTEDKISAKNRITSARAARAKAEGKA